MKKYLLLLSISILTIGNFVAFASFPITSSQENVINQEECDNIILKDGEEISAKVYEVTPDLVKYKKCGKLDGPLFSIKKSGVMMIRYSDGTKDIIKDVSRDNVKENELGMQQSYTQKETKAVNGFGIVAFACSFTGLFIAGLILGICGIIFGGIALAQEDKAKGLGIAGLILGLIEAAKLLTNGGILIVVSFHSLEDKIVKNFFNLYSNLKKNPSRYLPTKVDKSSLFKEISKKPLVADVKEVKENIRSRSAKLRYAIRNNNSFFDPNEFKKKFVNYFELEGGGI